MAPVISASFVTCEINGDFPEYSALAQQGNAQGITIVAASGDAGAAGCDADGSEVFATRGLSVNFPAVLPEVTDDDVRRAARAELCGYWAHAARRPLWWLNPVIADLGLTSMARGRHALQTGQLLTKTQAIEQAHAPAWLKDQLRARRQGQRVASPRARTALIAWRDARRTVAGACRRASA